MCAPDSLSAPAAWWKNGARFPEEAGLPNYLWSPSTLITNE